MVFVFIWSFIFKKICICMTVKLFIVLFCPWFFLSIENWTEAIIIIKMTQSIFQITDFFITLQVLLEMSSSCCKRNLVQCFLIYHSNAQFFCSHYIIFSTFGLNNLFWFSWLFKLDFLKNEISDEKILYRISYLYFHVESSLMQLYYYYDFCV